MNCGGTPLRVYARELESQGSWNSYEDYLTAPTFVWYNHSDGSSSDYAWLPGHWLSEQESPGDGSMYYQDSFGVQVFGGDFDPQQEPPEKRLPDYLVQDLIDNLWRFFPPIRGIITWGGSWPHPREIFAPPPPPPTPPSTPLPPSNPGYPGGKLPGMPDMAGGEAGSGDLPPGLVGWIHGFANPQDLCNYICRIELKLPFCKSLCLLASEGCDKLLWKCMNSRNDNWAKACMTLYDTICLGQ